MVYALLLAACTSGPDGAEPQPPVNPTAPRSVPRPTTPTSSDLIVGSGNVVSEPREVGPFTGLVIDLPAEAEVRLGDAPEVTLQADDNLIGAITTEVVDGSLVVGTSASFSTESEIVVQVVASSLDRVEVRGSGSIEVIDVEGATFEAAIRGSGSITGSGSVERLAVASSGSGSARLFDLSTEEADVTVDGSGTVEVTVTGSLRAAVTGSGTVVYGGDPAEVTTDIDGSGAIPPR